MQIVSGKLKWLRVTVLQFRVHYRLVLIDFIYWPMQINIEAKQTWRR